MIQVSVNDHVLGISREKIPMEYHSYYQVNPLEYSGLGLGLFITAEIIRKHSGDLWVERQLGTGLTFYFIITL